MVLFPPFAAAADESGDDRANCAHTTLFLFLCPSSSSSFSGGANEKLITFVQPFSLLFLFAGKEGC